MILAVIIILSIIPTGLVMADRWFKVLDPNQLNNYWRSNKYIDSTALPSYFLIIIPCILFLTGLIYFQRKRITVVSEESYRPIAFEPVTTGQRRLGYVFIGLSSIAYVIIVIKSLISASIPGWDLAYAWLGFVTGSLLITISVASIKAKIQVDLDYDLALVFAHFSVIGLMVGLYGKPDLLWSTVVLLILSVLNLWRHRRRVPLIFWIINLSIVGFCLGIDGWRTAAIGDEYNFLMTAMKMADIWNYTELGNHIFLSTNLGASYPFFPSLFHAIDMKFLGLNNFGWRFSNVYLSAISVGLFYYFCRSFLSKRVSITSAILFACSSYIMSFSKIGYDNLQALFAFSLAAALVARAIRSQSKLAFVCLGSVLALCFYVFPAALYVVPLPLIFLFLYYSPFDRQKTWNWVIMVLVWVCMIFPLMLQPNYWHGKVAGTFFNQPALLQSVSVLIDHFVKTFIYSFLSFLIIFNESHFIASSYVDPLTGSLILIGLPVLVFQARRQRFPLFILFTFVYFVFVIGTTHDRGFPPNTRMFLLIPIFTLIAAWGSIWVWEQIGLVFELSRKASVVIPGLFFLLLIGLNLYQAYPLSHIRYTTDQSFETQFIRMAKEISTIEKRSTKTFAVIDDETWDVEGLKMLQQAYPEFAYIKIDQIKIMGPDIPDEYALLLKDRNTIVFFFAGLNQSWRNPLDKQLREYNKEPCTIPTSSRDISFTYYRDISLMPMCYP
jgi:hypothetical protein